MFKTYKFKVLLLFILTCTCHGAFTKGETLDPLWDYLNQTKIISFTQKDATKDLHSQKSLNPLGFSTLEHL